MIRFIACVLVIGVSTPAFADGPSSSGVSRLITWSLATPLAGSAKSAGIATAGIAASPSVPTAIEQAAPSPTARPHELGIGGKAGGFTFGLGASGRMWQSDKVGVQVDLSHYGIGGLGILQVAPSVLFVPGNPKLDQPTQIRPYVGGGMNIFRTSYASYGSDTGIGGQGFAGAEIVFRGAPRFGLSGDLGYYSTGDFFGVHFGGFALSVMGHYYLR